MLQTFKWHILLLVVVSLVEGFWSDLPPHGNRILPFPVLPEPLYFEWQNRSVLGRHSHSGVVFWRDSRPGPSHRYACSILVGVLNFHSSGVIYLHVLLSGNALCAQGLWFANVTPCCFEFGRISVGLVSTWHWVLLCYCCVHVRCLLGPSLYFSVVVISCLCSVLYVTYKHGIHVAFYRTYPKASCLNVVSDRKWRRHVNSGGVDNGIECTQGCALQDIEDFNSFLWKPLRNW